MYIPLFVTGRLKVEMRELTLGEAAQLAQIPVAYNEAGIGRLLSAVVENSNVALSEWTVQERYAALVHYIHAQGKHEFSDGVGFADYLNNTPYAAQCYTFLEEDEDEAAVLEVVHLTGVYAEAVERLVLGGVEGMKGYPAFVVCTMAAQIRQAGSEENGVADELIHERVKQLLALPESAFERLFGHWNAAWQQMAHHLDLGFDQDGLVALPKEGTGLPAARFCLDAAFSQTTLQLWRSPEPKRLSSSDIEAVAADTHSTD